MENPSKMNVAVKWGAMIGIASVILSLLFYLTGMINMETGKTGWIGTIVSLAIPVAGIYMALNEYKKANNDNLTTGNGASIGILCGLVSGIISAVYTFIFMSYIAPEMLETIKEAQLASMDGMSNDQEEQMVKMMDLFMSPAVASVLSVLGSLILSLIIGFVLGLIMKNSNPNAEFEGA